jgi:hypothetical protein
MPSFLHRLTGYSCCNASAVAIATDRNIVDEFTGRPTTSYYNDDTFLAAKESAIPKNDDTVVVAKNDAVAAMEDAVVATDDNSTRRGRYRSSGASLSRRSSLRSVFSRSDSFMSTNSGVSVRSIPWYIKSMNTSFLFGNDNHEESCNYNDRSSRHQRTAVPMKKLEEEHVTLTDREETSSEEEEEEEEYIFYDTCCSEAGDSATVCTSNVKVENSDSCNGSGESFRLSSLLGTNIVRLGVDATTTVYNTDHTLQNSALVGLFYGDATQCQQTMEYVNLFTAGYYHDPSMTPDNPEEFLPALSVVFCNSTNDAIVPTSMPSYWYTLSQSDETTQLKRQLRSQFDIVETSGPTLVIFDPNSGAVVCSNAILEILSLDRSNADQYDTEACQLYERWIEALSSVAGGTKNSVRFEQVHVNDSDKIMIEYMDGERSEYERMLPYLI